MIVGFSGGPDSLVLLHRLHADRHLLLAAHLDHGIRPESGRDAEQAARLAGELGVEFVSEQAEVRTFAEAKKISIETAARQVRYEFLFRMAEQRMAQAVAVAHTADDQAETVLMHFLRGAGAAGMRGMAPRSLPNAWSEQIPLVRPLLGAWRTDVLAFCEARGLSPVMDPSNNDPCYTRNRLRHELIPQLESYNPQVRRAIVQSAELFSSEYGLLQDLAEAAWQSCRKGADADHLALDRKAFEQQPQAIKRMLLRKAYLILRTKGTELDASAVERALLHIHQARSPLSVNWLAGLSLSVQGNEIRISVGNFSPIIDGPQLKSGIQASLPIPGQFALENDWVLTSESSSVGQDLGDMFEDPFHAWLDHEKIGELLTVRTRRPGDRFQPLGMSGSMKLSDFMINSKLPEAGREAWPLVCKGETIVWIPGQRLAEPFRLGSDSRRAVHLRIYNRKSNVGFKVE